MQRETPTHTWRKGQVSVDVIWVGAGEEVLEALRVKLRELGVRHGAVVALIGAVERCEISNMYGGNPNSQGIASFHDPAELSGVGEVVDGEPHLHVTVSFADAVGNHGHLVSAHVGTHFVRAYVLPAGQAPS